MSGGWVAGSSRHALSFLGAWMRPGYFMPMYDMEAGQSIGGDALAQFAVDFSNRLYNVMGIRPSMYINGSYSSTMQAANQSLRDQLAKPGIAFSLVKKLLAFNDGAVQRV